MQNQITIVGGGFHEVPNLLLAIPSERVLNSDRISTTFSNPEMHGNCEAFLTDAELTKVQKHFCGIGGCCCDSVPPAIVYDPQSPESGASVRKLFSNLRIKSPFRLWAVWCEVDANANS
jgi:hypothetical protein